MNELKSFARNKIFKIASELIEKFDGDYQRVISDLRLIVTRDNALTEYLVGEGLRTIVNDVSRAGRLSKNRDLVTQKTRAILQQRPLSTWRLEDGTSLGMAVRPQLIAAAERLEAVAVGMISRAILYRRIASKLQDDSTPASSVITDEEIAHEFSSAEESAVQLISSGANNA